MFLYFSRIEFGTPAFDETLALRDKILRKPLKLDFTIAQITEEYRDIHLGAYDSNGVLVGCLVLNHSDEEIKMRQVAIDNRIQKKGLGTRLVQYSESIARDLSFKKMVLHARDTAVPFYLKLNYEITGKAFLEVGIEHFKMYKKL